MKRIVLLILVFTFSNAVIGQNLNGYKYAFVPSKFTFLDEADKFQLNTLSKLFMQKYGFETYSETDTAPFDFTNTNCNKVYVNLLKNNTLFLTRLKVVLSDCNGKVLFVSKEGSSKEKELRVAYNQALREAFASFESLNYKYDEKVTILKSVETIPTKEVVQETKVVTSSTNATTSEQLYAQPIQNGFQLVNSEPKVIMKLYKTSVKDFYTAVKGDVQGVFVSKNNVWFFEYYQNDKLISEKMEVKF